MTALSRLGSTSTTTVTAAPPLYRLLQLTLSRFYGAVSAAQPQLDPDYYNNNNNNNYFYYQAELEPPRDGLRSAPALDTEGSVPRRGVQWAFIGSPRAKKHVYAETLSKLLEVPHISMTSLVRQELNPRSSLYKQIADAVNRGELVPEDIIFGLLSERLKDGYYRGETGFILDGIPRSQIQAEILDQLAEIDLVVNFRCTDDFVVKDQGGTISHKHRDINNYHSTSFDMQSQHTQPKSSTAIAEGSWKEKLQAYAEQRNILEAYYRKQKKLVDFQVGSAPVETWQGLLAVLHLQHVNAVHSSQKMTGGSHFL